MEILGSTWLQTSGVCLETETRRVLSRAWKRLYTFRLLLSSSSSSCEVMEKCVFAQTDCKGVRFKFNQKKLVAKMNARVVV